MADGGFLLVLGLSIGRGPGRSGSVQNLLYEAANSIQTRSEETFALKTWAMKVAKHLGLKKARVALARRLAVIMHAVLRDGTLSQA